MGNRKTGCPCCGFLSSSASTASSSVFTECPPKGWLTQYSHMDKTSVTIGQKLEKGDLIGEIGTKYGRKFLGEVDYKFPSLQFDCDGDPKPVADRVPTPVFPAYNHLHFEVLEIQDFNTSVGCPGAGELFPAWWDGEEIYKTEVDRDGSGETYVYDDNVRYTPDNNSFIEDARNAGVEYSVFNPDAVKIYHTSIKIHDELRKFGVISCRTMSHGRRWDVAGGQWIQGNPHRNTDGGLGFGIDANGNLDGDVWDRVTDRGADFCGAAIRFKPANFYTQEQQSFIRKSLRLPLDPDHCGPCDSPFFPADMNPIRPDGNNGTWKRPHLSAGHTHGSYYAADISCHCLDAGYDDPGNGAQWYGYVGANDCNALTGSASVYNASGGTVDGQKIESVVIHDGRPVQGCVNDPLNGDILGGYMADSIYIYHYCVDSSSSSSGSSGSSESSGFSSSFSFSSQSESHDSSEEESSELASTSEMSVEECPCGTALWVYDGDCTVPCYTEFEAYSCSDYGGGVYEVIYELPNGIETECITIGTEMTFVCKGEKYKYKVTNVDFKDIGNLQIEYVSGGDGPVDPCCGEYTGIVHKYLCCDEPTPPESPSESPSSESSGGACFPDSLRAEDEGSWFDLGGGVWKGSWSQCSDCAEEGDTVSFTKTDPVDGITYSYTYRISSIELDCEDVVLTHISGGRNASSDGFWLSPGASAQISINPGGTTHDIQCCGQSCGTEEVVAAPPSSKGCGGGVVDGLTLTVSCDSSCSFKLSSSESFSKPLTYWTELWNVTTNRLQSASCGGVGGSTTSPLDLCFLSEGRWALSSGSNYKIIMKIYNGTCDCSGCGSDTGDPFDCCEPTGSVIAQGEVCFSGDLCSGSGSSVTGSGTSSEWSWDGDSITGTVKPPPSCATQGDIAKYTSSVGITYFYNIDVVNGSRLTLSFAYNSAGTSDKGDPAGKVLTLVCCHSDECGTETAFPKGDFRTTLHNRLDFSGEYLSPLTCGRVGDLVTFTCEGVEYTYKITRYGTGDGLSPTGVGLYFQHNSIGTQDAINPGLGCVSSHTIHCCNGTKIGESTSFTNAELQQGGYKNSPLPNNSVVAGGAIPEEATSNLEKPNGLSLYPAIGIDDGKWKMIEENCEMKNCDSGDNYPDPPADLLVMVFQDEADTVYTSGATAWNEDLEYYRNTVPYPDDECVTRVALCQPANKAYTNGCNIKSLIGDNTLPPFASYQQMGRRIKDQTCTGNATSLSEIQTIWNRTVQTNFPSGVGILVDNSGSMREADIQPALGEFIDWLKNKYGKELCIVEKASITPTERWIKASANMAKKLKEECGCDNVDPDPPTGDPSGECCQCVPVPPWEDYATLVPLQPGDLEKARKLYPDTEDVCVVRTCCECAGSSSSGESSSGESSSGESSSALSSAESSAVSSYSVSDVSISSAESSDEDTTCCTSSPDTLYAQVQFSLYPNAMECDDDVCVEFTLEREDVDQDCTCTGKDVSGQWKGVKEVGCVICNSPTYGDGSKEECDITVAIRVRCCCEDETADGYDKCAEGAGASYTLEILGHDGNTAPGGPCCIEVPDEPCHPEFQVDNPTCDGGSANALDAWVKTTACNSGVTNCNGQLANIDFVKISTNPITPACGGSSMIAALVSPIDARTGQPIGGLV